MFEPMTEIAPDATANTETANQDANPDIVAVEYWASTRYSNDEEANGRFFMEIVDRRAQSGQLFVDVATEDGDPDDLLTAAFEINRLPGSKTDVQCLHLHFNADAMAMSIFKQGDRYILRPEAGVNIRNTVLPNGEHAFILE